MKKSEKLITWKGKMKEGIQKLIQLNCKKSGIGSIGSIGSVLNKTDNR